MIAIVLDGTGVMTSRLDSDNRKWGSVISMRLFRDVGGADLPSFDNARTSSIRFAICIAQLCREGYHCQLGMITALLDLYRLTV
jgi:hypothetical protein